MTDRGNAEPHAYGGRAPVETQASEFSRSHENHIVKHHVVPALSAVVVVLLVFFIGKDINSRLIQVALASGIAFGALLVTIGTLKRVLLGIALLEVPVGIDIYIGHDPFVAASNAISGYFLSVTTFALVALYLIWAIESLSGRDRYERLHGRVIAAIAAYPAALLASLLVARSLELAMFEILIVVQGTLLLAYLIHAVRRKGDVVFVLIFLLIGPIFQGILAVGAFGPLANIDMSPLSELLTSTGRAVGSFGSANVLGGYLVLLLPVSLCVVVVSKSLALQITGGLATLLSSLGLVLSQSRGAWVAGGLTVGTLLVLLYRRRLLGRAAIVSIAVFVIIVIALLGAEIVDRLSQPDGGAAIARIPLMSLALLIISDNPLLGVGANNFAYVLGNYLSADYTGAWISTVHNKYLLLWAETGVTGLVAWLWLLTVAIRSGFTVWKEDTAFLGPIALGLVLGLIASMIQALTEIYQGRETLMVMVVIGLLFAIAQIHRDTRSRLATSDALPGRRGD